jgi:DNA-binding LacI/PurR family transcriptional regulator
LGVETAGLQRKAMRVIVLLGDRISNMDAGFQSLLFNLQHDLEVAGHSCVFSSKLFTSQASYLLLLAEFVQETKANARVLIGGEHRMLQWFSQQEIPAIALGGRCLGLPIASTGMATLAGFRQAIRHLTDLGHRRIVFLTPRFFRGPAPGTTVLAFQEELARCGVTATNYHLPDWDETPDGASRLIKSLLQVTPPNRLRHHLHQLDDRGDLHSGQPRISHPP